jgi:hypothetical protein
MCAVPRSIFERSAVFQDMWSLPQPGGTPADGTDADHPLRLDGVSAVDWKSFLRIVMPL